MTLVYYYIFISGFFTAWKMLGYVVMKRRGKLPPRLHNKPVWKVVLFLFFGMPLLFGYSLYRAFGGEIRRPQL